MRIGNWLGYGSLWLASTLLMAGCATTPLESQQNLVLKERAGKFSVVTLAANDDSESVQGSFVWRRLVSGWQLDLQSPLGATLARLTVEPTGATLEQPDAPLRRAASGEDLLAGVLGAKVPLDVLEDWVDGRVIDDDKVTSLKRDRQGRIVSFNQAGWQVMFDRYGESGPARVTAKGQQLGRSVTLRLIAEQPI
ncbi:MAG: outer membrane lipoprotein LolB [Burkholderiaceae bacterium]|nr:outer membrane lipoprotein LolB [Burkholderiaceae bacterium]MCD8537643.1 outer membrane lipoprotein LolB [Burkholderiaceae bacterium]MCD8566042.1 outer membrane lipoprotein LolB [Burkholderiaceae bacterium]